VWTARYPDLAGKVALLTGDFPGIAEIAEVLAANAVPICVVNDDREVVDAALAASEASASGAMGVAASAVDAATWRRVLPHAEQRLGPIDILVAAGSGPAREAVIAAALPDMTARRRGVIVEVGYEISAVEPPVGVRRRAVVLMPATPITDAAPAVALCASDVLSAPQVTVTIAG
jgi:NADP-dependent 3-hydroxy acid dehydrogenase YdfG